jgi:hypothetical protein
MSKMSKIITYLINQLSDDLTKKLLERKSFPMLLLTIWLNLQPSTMITTLDNEKTK